MLLGPDKWLNCTGAPCTSHYTADLLNAIGDALYPERRTAIQAAARSAGIAASSQSVEEPSLGSRFFAPEKKGLEKGMIGGLIMMIVAVVWFIVGYESGYIFFYPPVLFLIGLYGFLKGLFSGNVSGAE